MPLEFTTLEGLGDVPERITLSGTPHWSVLRNNKFLASDITSAGSFGFKNNKGAAIGVNGAADYSQFGVFTDRHGNTIIITQEDKNPYAVIKDKLYAGRVHQFNLPRKMGAGGAFEANAYMVAGIEERYGGYAGWIDGITVDFYGKKITYHQVPILLQKLEALGQKFDRPVLVVLSGTPVSLSSVIGNIVNIVFAVARPFLSSLGIPPQLFDIIQNSVTQLVKDGRVSLDNLANAVLPMCPPEVRAYIDKGKAIYNGATTGNYAAAAKELGVGLGNVEQFANSVKAGDITGILGNIRGDYETAYAKLQNAFNIQTVNKLARATRSGSVFQQITDFGTISKVPTFRNAIFAASGNTHIGTLPNIQDLSAKVLQETNDAENVNVAKGFIQASLGYPVSTSAFDSILEKSMIEQALEQAQNGRRTYVMPVTVPYAKRAQMMETVAKNTGLRVVVGKATAQDKFTVCEWC